MVIVVLPGCPSMLQQSSRTGDSRKIVNQVFDHRRYHRRCQLSTWRKPPPPATPHGAHNVRCAAADGGARHPATPMSPSTDGVLSTPTLYNRPVRLYMQCTPTIDQRRKRACALPCFHVPRCTMQHAQQPAKYQSPARCAACTMYRRMLLIDFHHLPARHRGRRSPQTIIYLPCWLRYNTTITSAGAKTTPRFSCSCRRQSLIVHQHAT